MEYLRSTGIEPDINRITHTHADPLWTYHYQARQ
jgi:hypothetical protein